MVMPGSAWLESWRPAAVYLAEANSRHTRRSYGVALRQFAAHASVLLAEVREAHVAGFKAWLVDLGRSPATIRHRLGVLRSFFAWAIDRGLHPGPNPAALISRPKRRGVTVSVSLDREQVERLLAACQTDRDRAMMAFMADGGLRVGDVVALNQRDLSTDGGRVVVIIRAGKGGRTRKVALTRRAAGLARLYLSNGPRVSAWCMPLFQDLGGRGRPLSERHVARLVSQAADRAGLGWVSPHDLRRTFATRALQAGAPLPLVQAEMGHQTMAETVAYYVPSPGGGTLLRERPADYLDAPAWGQIPERCEGVQSTFPAVDGRGRAAFVAEWLASTGQAAEILRAEEG